MQHHDLDARDALRRLSTPVDALHLERHGMDRRRFLQTMAAGVGGGLALGGLGSATASILGVDTGDRAWAGPPVAANDGILVTVFMYGGNDGLNTLVPYADGNYYAYRGSLAVPAGQVLALDGHVGLHPNLGYLKQRYDAGEVAVIQGVGAPGHDLSHFTSQARWMFGSSSAGSPTSGWIGRWLDGLDSYDALRAVTIGNSVPLSIVGEYRRGTAIPEAKDGFGSDTDAPSRLMYDAVRDFGASGAGRGAWHDAIAAVESLQLDVVAAVNPLLEAALPENPIQRRLALAARLINADIGVRAIDVGWGDFDSHKNQSSMHPARMQELNDGLQLFFSGLSDTFRSQVSVLVISEFGRTPWANDSDGSDHGEAGVAFLVGQCVRGGLHGAYPSLAGKGRWDQLTPTVDFRAIYTSVVDHWLGGDPAEVLGAAYPGLDLFARTPGYDAAVPASPQLAGDFVPLSPFRVLDTRSNIGTQHGALGAGDSIDIGAMGVGGVPLNDVTAVAFNVTVTGGSTDSYLTLWPRSEGRPEVSTVNWSKNATVPNLVVMRPGTRGRVSAWNAFGTVHVIADIVGYFRDTDSDRLLPLNPFRLLDTRNGVGVAAGKLGAGQHLDLQATGVAGSGVPSAGIDAVVLNVTVDQPTKESYLTVWPTGEALPNASSLNFVKGQTVPNLVIAKVGAGGQVSVFNAAGETHVIADVVGCFASAGLGRHHTTSPTRILDTRNGIGARGRLGGSAIPLEVWGTAGIPNGASGVVMNVTVTDPDATSYLSLWPSGEPMPTTSSLNYTAGLTVANLVVVKLGTDGAVAIANAFGSTHVIADVLGYFQ